MLRVVTVVVALGLAPAQRSAADPASKQALLAAERAAFDKAKPVFDKWCASCHVRGAAKATKKKLSHFDMTSYPFRGHHAADISHEIRKSLAIGGGKPTMPMNKKGALSGDELALVAAWADAFDAAAKGGAHKRKPHHHARGHHKH